MKVFRIILIVLLYLLFAYCAQAQPGPRNVMIDSVAVEREGTTFTIRYNLEFGELVQDCVVKLLLIVNGRELTQDIVTGVSGDLGTIKESGRKTIIWQCPPGDVPKLAEKQLVFKVSVSEKRLKRAKAQENNSIKQPHEPKFKDPIYREKRKKSPQKTFVQASLQMSKDSRTRFGAMVGAIKKVGFYAKGASDFKFPLRNEGEVTMSSDVWLASPSVTTFSTGVMLPFTKSLTAFLGAGPLISTFWGKSASTNAWVKVPNYSYLNAIIETGVVFDYQLFSLMLGFGQSFPKNPKFSFNFGIGVCI